jgi:hypothetical protein
MWNSIKQFLRHYISPVYVAMLVASFVLWYIAKLNYTYTTEQQVRISVGNEHFQVACVVEGLGTHLFSRMVYMRNSIKIPLSELDYTPSPTQEGYIVLDAQSLQNAISVHYSDVKVMVVKNIPQIKMPEP